MEVREPSAKYLARPAYKQTEVGMIPEDWRCITTAELVEPDAPICYGVVQVGRNTDDGIPIVAIKYVKEIAQAPLHRTAAAIERPYSRSRVRRGDVLISIKGTIGRVGLVPTGFEGNISRELARLRPRPEYSGAYVAHQLEADATQTRISKEVVGTTRLEFSIATLRKFILAFPGSFPEQQAIAEALSDADALIDALAQLLAKKRQIKQGAMQKLLTGQRRLPGFAGEWEVRQLGDVAVTLKGSGLTKGLVSASGSRPCVLYGELFTTYGRVITSIVSRTDSDDGCRSIAGDVLMPGSTTTSGIDLATASALFEDGVALGGDINVIRKRGEYYDPGFLANYLTAVKRKQIADISQGITIHHLYGRDLALLPIELPSLAEQTAIATLLSDMDAELAALEAKLAKARGVKQGMMQELLTGRIRLV